MSALSVRPRSDLRRERAVLQWQDFETSSPTAKLRLLAEKLNVPFSSGEEPWQTVRWLCRYRNMVAHAKPERVVRDEVISQAEHESRSFRAPLSKLELLVTEESARKAYAAVNEVKLVLCAALPQKTASAWRPMLGLLMLSSTMVPNPSIERTSQRPLRALWPAADVER